MVSLPPHLCSLFSRRFWFESKRWKSLSGKVSVRKRKIEDLVAKALSRLITDDCNIHRDAWACQRKSQVLVFIRAWHGQK